MTDEDALLRAIALAPDDDLPRLVYADWLDERGATATGDRARAEFIRLQCEAAAVAKARPLPASERDGLRRLRARAYGLLRRNKDRWATGAAGMAIQCRYERGMPERLVFPARVFCCSPGALDLVPVRWLCLTFGGKGALPLVRRVMADPVADRLKILELLLLPRMRRAVLSALLNGRACGIVPRVDISFLSGTLAEEFRVQERLRAKFGNRVRVHIDSPPLPREGLPPDTIPF